MHAIVIAAQGGPEVLEYVERPDPTPGDGEVVIDVAASGVNFLDEKRKQVFLAQVYVLTVEEGKNLVPPPGTVAE